MLEHTSAPADKAVTTDNAIAQPAIHDSIQSLSEFNTTFKSESKSTASLADFQTASLYGSADKYDQSGESYQQGSMGSPNHNQGDAGQNPGGTAGAESTQTPSSGGDNNWNSPSNGDGKGQDGKDQDGKDQNGKGDSTPPPSSHGGFKGSNGGDGGGDAGPPNASIKLNLGDVIMDKKDVPDSAKRINQNILPHVTLTDE